MWQLFQDKDLCWKCWKSDPIWSLFISYGPKNMFVYQILPKCLKISDLYTPYNKEDGQTDMQACVD